MNLGVYPFGEGTFLRADMNSQYSAFITYLRSILLGENDLFYSFSMNGGGNFYFLYTYYLANPFNWLMALVPAEDIPQALTFFILIRLGLAGLTMNLYLRRIRLLDAHLASWLWTRTATINGRRVIAVDGKTMRRARAALDIRAMDKPSDHAPVWAVFK